MIKHCPKELYIEKNSSIKNLVLYVTHDDIIPPPPNPYLWNFSDI
jgi:hypothetical protein